MGKSEIRWLHQQMPELVRRGVLTPEAAAALGRHYGPPATGSSRSIALVIFSSLGAVLVGGGVILILAHNWEDLSRPARAAISVGILLAAQSIAAFTLARRSGSPAWREAAGGGVVLAAAASIALVSQTYNLGGELPEYLRTVILLSLPVVYLLDSALAAALVWLAMTIFIFDWNRDQIPGWWYWIFAAGSVPFLVRLAMRREREWRLLAALVAIAGVIAFVTLGSWSHQLNGWMIPLAGLLAAYWALGARHGAGGAESWRVSFLAIGGAGWPIVSLILTFGQPWEIFDHARDFGREAVTGWITLAAGVVTGALASAHAVSEARSSRWHMALPAALILPVALAWSLALRWGPPPAQVLMNLWLLACGLVFIGTGLRAMHLGTINYGLVLVSALAFARFFDVEISFLWRGIGFILVGLAFFGVNFFVLARRREVRG